MNTEVAFVSSFGLSVVLPFLFLWIIYFESGDTRLLAVGASIPLCAQFVSLCVGILPYYVSAKDYRMFASGVFATSLAAGFACVVLRGWLLGLKRGARQIERSDTG